MAVPVAIMALRTFRSMALAYPSRSRFSTSRRPGMPAWFHSTSSPPRRTTASSMKCRQTAGSSRSATSAAQARGGGGDDAVFVLESHGLSLDEISSRGGSDFQPFLADGRVGAQLGRRALEDDGAVAHDVDALGDVERDGELLLDQQDGDAAALERLQVF